MSKHDRHRPHRQAPSIASSGRRFSPSKCSASTRRSRSLRKCGVEPRQYRGRAAAWARAPGAEPRRRGDRCVAAIGAAQQRSRIGNPDALALGAAGHPTRPPNNCKHTVAPRPPFPPAVIELSRLFCEAARFEEAIELLQSGLVLSTDHIDLRLALGYLHLKHNDRTTARSVFQRVREVAPEPHETLVALGVGARWRICRSRRSRSPRAGAVPKRCAHGINLGKCLLEMGERDADHSMLRAATRTAPQLAGAPSWRSPPPRTAAHFLTQASPRPSCAPTRMPTRIESGPILPAVDTHRARDRAGEIERPRLLVSERRGAPRPFGSAAQSASPSAARR